MPSLRGEKPGAVQRLVVGVDEAGRGPLIGPMIVAALAIPEDALNRLESLGVTDSKALEPAERERLYPSILREAVHAVIVEVPPEAIDEVNLNTLEHDTIAYAVSRIARLLRPVRVSADTVGPPDRLRALLQRLLGPEVEVRVAAKAETRYPEVAAASIVAKVVRDRRVRELARVYGDFGSGYPTDPKTIEWVRRVYAENPDSPPPIVRRTWSTLRRLAPRWYRVKGGGGSKTLLDYLGKG